MLFGAGPGPGQKAGGKASKDEIKKAVKCDMCKDLAGGQRACGLPNRGGGTPVAGGLCGRGECTPALGWGHGGIGAAP